MNETEVLEVALAAIKKDDSITLSILLDLGLSPDAKVDKYNRTLMHKCAEYDAYDCANVHSLTQSLVSRQSCSRCL